MVYLYLLIFQQAYKNWLNSVNDEKEETILEHTTKSSVSTPTSIEKIPEAQKSSDSVIDNSESLPGLEHLSGEQLFFLNFAQV